MFLAKWGAEETLKTAFPENPSLRLKLTPKYALGCKRIIHTSEYYPIMACPNVKLHTDPIVEVAADGIRTVDGDNQTIDVRLSTVYVSIFQYLTHILFVLNRNHFDLIGTSTWNGF